MVPDKGIPKHVLVVELLTEMVLSVLAIKHKRDMAKPDPSTLSLVEIVISRQDEEFVDQELTAQLFGAYDFVRVA